MPVGEDGDDDDDDDDDDDHDDEQEKRKSQLYDYRGIFDDIMMTMIAILVASSC